MERAQSINIRYILNGVHLNLLNRFERSFFSQTRNSSHVRNRNAEKCIRTQFDEYLHQICQCFLKNKRREKPKRREGCKLIKVNLLLEKIIYLATNLNVYL